MKTRWKLAFAVTLICCLLLSACKAAPDEDAKQADKPASQIVISSAGSEPASSGSGSAAQPQASGAASSRAPGSSASASRGESAAKAPLRFLTGTLEAASADEISVRADDGVYRFRRTEDTVVAGGSLLLGCSVSLSYRGQASPGVLADAVLEKITVLPEDHRDGLQKMVESMSLEDKVGQMFLARCPSSGAADAVGQYQPGGYVLFGRDFSGKTAKQVKSDISSYQKKARIPLLIAVDEEGGTVNRVSTNKKLRDTPFLSPRALYEKGGFPLIASDTQEKAKFLKSFGINVNLAPVCDVSTSAKDYIYPRAFGQDGKGTAKYVETVVAQMEKERIGSVLKHFPGYGNNADTHTDVVHDDRPYSRFESEDFLPFAAGIAAGADGVLVSHNIVSCMDAKLPASLSPRVHEILRTELGFQGVIITDDLVMDAIRKYTDNKNAAVLAVKAGNDLLCCTDFKEQIPAVIDAVKSGEISESRIEESVRRILQWKIDLGLLEQPD